MWTVAYMAQSKDIASALQEILAGESIPVKLRPISKSDDKTDSYYEVLVSETEMEKTHSIIIEKGY